MTATLQHNDRILKIEPTAPLTAGQGAALRAYWPRVAAVLTFQVREMARHLGLAQPTPELALATLWGAIDLGMVDGGEWSEYARAVRWPAL